MVSVSFVAQDVQVVLIELNPCEYLYANNFKANSLLRLLTC